MTEETSAYQISHEIALLFGGNGLSVEESRQRVEDRIRILVDHRRDLIQDKKDLLGENAAMRKKFDELKSIVFDRDRTVIFLATQAARAAAIPVELP